MLKTIKLGRYLIRVRSSAVTLSFITISFLLLLHVTSYNNDVDINRSRSVCNEIKGTQKESSDWVEGGGKLISTMNQEREKAQFPITPKFHTKFHKIEHCNVNPDQIKWSMICVVKSSAFNIERRKAIRETWASVKVFENVRLEVIYVVGLTSNETLQNLIIKESESHGDILQFNMVDSAKTVPEKVLAGMQWVSENIPASWLYSSLDDDVVVQVPNLITFLNSLIQPALDSEPHCPTKMPLVCVYNYQSRDVPNRNIDSKWYISNDQYSGNSWPEYCRGGLYTLPVEMVVDMFAISRRTEYLYLDDVWITGFMRRKLGDGDVNIIPAPNAIRSEFSFYFNFFNSHNTLAQHLWGDVYYIWENVNVVSKLYKVWDSWRGDLEGHQVCVSY